MISASRSRDITLQDIIVVSTVMSIILHNMVNLLVVMMMKISVRWWIDVVVVRKTLFLMIIV